MADWGWSYGYQYFNPAAFAKPAAGTFGSLGRDTMTGPGLGPFDFSVFKRVPIKLTSASFGQISQTRNGSSAPGLGFGEPRNTQLGMKITF